LKFVLRNSAIARAALFTLKRITKNMPIAISIIGVTGKMGRSVLAAALKDPDFTIAGGCASQRSSFIGKDIGEIIAEKPTIGILIENNLDKIFKDGQVVIDFSDTKATLGNLETAIKHRKPFVIGSTGHSQEIQSAIEVASKEIPLLYSPNFSFGIALCFQAAAFFAKNLNGICYIDIIETHHIQKKDSPSGTALAFAEAMQQKKINFTDSLDRPRSKGNIAIHSIRSGEVIGKHKLVFECEGERIELHHEAFSRSAFAKGALLAAKFLSFQPNGLYSLKDLLKAEVTL
jgi:4-hydroxy-tetrahydrodipicolinate reductase